MSKNVEIPQNLDSFKNEFFKEYERLRQSGNVEKSAVTLAKEVSTQYKIDGATALAELTKDPRFEDLGSDKISFTLNQMFEHVSNFFSSFFASQSTENASMNSEVSTVLGQGIAPSKPTSDNNSSENSNNTESTGSDKTVSGTVKSAADTVVSKVEDGVEAVKDKATEKYEEGKAYVDKRAKESVSEGRTAAFKNGFVSTMKYLIQNDLSTALGWEWLRQIGDGVYRRAMERIPTIKLETLQIISSMDLHDFLKLTEGRGAGESITYSGKQYPMSELGPLRDFLQSYESQLPQGKLSIKEALMLTCVSNEFERTSARVLRLAFVASMQAPKNAAYTKYLIHKSLRIMRDFGKFSPDMQMEISKGMKKLEPVMEALKDSKLDLVLEKQEDMQRKLAAMEEVRSEKLTNAHTSVAELEAEEKRLAKKKPLTDVGKQQNADKLKEVRSKLATERDHLNSLKSGDEFKAYQSKKKGLQGAVDKYDDFLGDVAKKKSIDPADLRKMYDQRGLEKVHLSVEKLEHVGEGMTGRKAKDPLKTDKLRSKDLTKLDEARHDWGRMKKENIKAQKGIIAELSQESKRAAGLNKELQDIQKQLKNKVGNQAALQKRLANLQVEHKALVGKVNGLKGKLTGLNDDIARLGKEFFSKNEKLIKLAVENDAGWFPRKFKGAIMKNGTIFIMAGVTVKQIVDIAREEQTLAQGLSDIWSVGTAFIPFVGTYQDAKAYITGRDEAGRILSYKDRMFRAGMAGVGLVADVSSFAGVGLWLRGAIGGTKVAVRGTQAAVRGARIWKAAGGVAKTGGKISRGAEMALDTMKGFGKGIINPKLGLKNTLGFAWKNKAKLLVGSAIVGGVHLGATLTPVGEGGGNVTFTQSDLAPVQDELAEYTT